MMISQGRWYRDRETHILVLPIRAHFGASPEEGRWLCRDEYGLLGNYLVEELADVEDLEQTLEMVGV